MSDSSHSKRATQPLIYRGSKVPRRRIIELTIVSPRKFTNPSVDAYLTATFTAPSRRQVTWQGFWNGGNEWSVRFSPDEEGQWHYQLRLLDQAGVTVASSAGSFTTTPMLNETVFDRHGPIQLATDRRNLIHTEGTPFFWLADTAWNGPLLSTDGEWDRYLAARTRQNFSAVQWVATHWRASPTGDISGQLAFEGAEPIKINPAFFQRLDGKIESIVAAGLVSVPVMLWAIGAGNNPTIDPGYGLSEADAILLARYQVARWAAFPTVWILAGDGKYFGDYAARWRRIGQATFGDQPHAPVAIHCGGEQWPAEEFRGEPWLDILGYQSGHGDSDKTLNWIVNGPPATDWQKEPRLFQLNLEPAYENHVAYHSRQPHTPHSVRMAMYWSLLNAPTAGVSYGGHGVWGWDDGKTAPMDHGNSGTPLPWQQALTMPGAEDVTYIANTFTSIAWWTLFPAPQLLLDQPGNTDVRKTILVSASDARDLIVAYTPAGGEIRLNAAPIPAGLKGTWHDPRTGAQHSASSTTSGSVSTYIAPDDDDWLLIIQMPQ